MALTKEDLQNIGALINTAIQPINERLDKLENNFLELKTELTRKVDGVIMGVEVLRKDMDQRFIQANEDMNQRFIQANEDMNQRFIQAKKDTDNSIKKLRERLGLSPTSKAI